MPPLRPKPVDLRYCTARERSLWAARARLSCGAARRCPVILAYDLLCPPCLIGRKAHVAPWQGDGPLFRAYRSRKTGKMLFRHPNTLRALVGPLFLAMISDTSLSPAAPLPISLDYLEESGWIDCAERNEVEILARLLPYSVYCQRAQLGRLSPPWPGQAPRPFAIQHAYPLLIEKGSL